MSALVWKQKQIAYGTPAHDDWARGRKGNTTTVRCLDLHDNPYVTGGWTLGRGDTMLKEVWGVEQILGRDPMDRVLDPVHVHVVPTFLPGGVVKIQLYRTSGEAANAYTAAAGHLIWLRFIGTR